MIVEYEQAMGQAAMQAKAVHCVRNTSSRFARLAHAAAFECDSVEIAGRNIRLPDRDGASMQERGFSPSHFPADRWLSPMHRSHAFFNLDASPVIYASRGFQVVDYELPNIDLNQFLVRAQ
jgi:hypothetical protein